MDLKALSDKLELDMEDFSDLVELFITTSRTDIENFKVACENGDAAMASEAVHSLKGSSGNLGFRDLSQEAQNAENQAKNENLDGLIAFVAIFADHVAAIETALRTQTGSSGN